AYMVQVGVFSGDWTTLYAWDNDAAPFSVVAVPLPPQIGRAPCRERASFTIGTATLSPAPAAAGQGATITTQITQATSDSNLVIDLEIYDAGNTKITQQIFPGQSCGSGQTRSFSWSWPGTAAQGAYMVQVGVFSGDWTTLYTWDNDAAPFSVVAVPLPP